MGRQHLRRLGEHHGLFVLEMLVDMVLQRVESGLKHLIVVGLLQGCHEFPELLMVLQCITDQPLALLVGLLSNSRVEHRFFQEHVECQLGKDMLGNDLLQVRIGRILILLEERAYLAVIRCEHRNSIARLVSCLVIISMGRLCHEILSFYLYVQRQGAAVLSSYMLYTDSKCYAKAIRLTHVWGVLAMGTQACFDVGGIIRGLHAYNVCFSIWRG